MKLRHITKYILKEEVRFTKDKSKELIEKYRKEVDRYKSAIKVLYGKFSGYSLADLLEESDINNFKKLFDTMEKLSEKIEKDAYQLDDIGSDMYDEYDENEDKEAYKMSNEARNISAEYSKLTKGLDVLKDISQVLIDKLEDLKEDEKLDDIKDFQQGIK